MSTRVSACCVTSTGKAIASDSAMTLAALTSPGSAVRKLPKSTTLNTSRESVGRDRYHGSSHIRESMSHAIQVTPERARAKTRIPVERIMSTLPRANP